MTSLSKCSRIKIYSTYTPATAIELFTQDQFSVGKNERVLFPNESNSVATEHIDTEWLILCVAMVICHIRINK